MDDYGSRRLNNSGIKKNFYLDYVDDSGHQVTMENPRELLKVLRKCKIFCEHGSDRKEELEEYGNLKN